MQRICIYLPIHTSYSYSQAANGSGGSIVKVDLVLDLERVHVSLVDAVPQEIMQLVLQGVRLQFKQVRIIINKNDVHVKDTESGKIKSAFYKKSHP